MKIWSHFGANSKHRWHILRNMVDSLIVHERIKTTVAKAKQLKRLADRMITMGRVDTGKSRSKANGVLRTPEALEKLFDVLGPRFAPGGVEERNGGYVRVQRTAPRKGDNAPMAFIEYLGWEAKLADETDLIDGIPVRMFMKARRGPA
jgi:large subunit ribosomal protein L17